MHKAHLKQELEVLFETGSGIAERFGREQEGRQKALDAWKESGEEGDPPAAPPGNVDFQLRYQRWYTCALPLVREAAPDRYAEFQGYYEQTARKPTDRTFAIQDYFVHYSAAEYDHVPWLETLRCFLNQLYIVRAASDRLEWRSIADSLDHSQRELQLAELETARRLIPANPQAAAAIAGTVLQYFLQSLAKQHKLRFRKLSPQPREVADSLKEAKVLDDDVWRQCTWLAGIHERCFSESDDPLTPLQARDFVDSTHWLLTNVF